MERCANTEALNRYEREQDKADQRQAAFENEVSDELYERWEEMEADFKRIAEHHNIDVNNLFDYIKENW